MKKRDKLYAKFIKTREPLDLKTFKMFRNKLSKELRKARDAYFLQMFSSCMNDSKKLWNRLNALMNRNQRSDPIEQISLNGRLLVKEDLANAFNDYFVHRDVDLNHPMPHYVHITPNANTIFFSHSCLRMFVLCT